MGRDREKELEKQLIEIDNQLNVSTTEYVQEKYESVKKELREIDKVKTDGLIVRSKIKYFEEGEKSTAFFFSLEKANSKKRNITKLKDENGYVITEKDEILKMQKSYYENCHFRIRIR